MPLSAGTVAAAAALLEPFLPAERRRAVAEPGSGHRVGHRPAPLDRQERFQQRRCGRHRAGRERHGSPRQPCRVR